MKHWIALQIKPAGELCNYNCLYCYNHKRPSKCKIMPTNVLINILEKYIQYSPRHLIFSWHGGEPTLAGLEFFQTMENRLNRLKRKNQTVSHMIQTNASLLNKEFAIFFKRNNFKVGVSLDGPCPIHSQHRFSKNGENSFTLTMKGIEVLRNNQIEPGIICTVTKKNYLFAKEILKFLVENGFYNLTFSPVVYISNPKIKSDELVLNSEDWFTFLRDLFYEWCNFNNSKIQIRELNEIIAWTIGKPLNLCASGKACPHWFSINPEGDISSCEYYNSGLTYGNILKTNFDGILKNENFRSFKKSQAKPNSKCKHCEFWHLCGNGCSRMRHNGNYFDLKGIYFFCEQKKRLFKEVNNYFNRVMKREEVNNL